MEPVRDLLADYRDARLRRFAITDVRVQPRRAHAQDEHLVLRRRDALRASRFREELHVTLPFRHVPLQLLVWDVEPRVHDLGEED